MRWGDPGQQLWCLARAGRACSSTCRRCRCWAPERVGRVSEWRLQRRQAGVHVAGMPCCACSAPAAAHPPPPPLVCQFACSPLRLYGVAGQFAPPHQMHAHSHLLFMCSPAALPHPPCAPTLPRTAPCWMLWWPTLPPPPRQRRRQGSCALRSFTATQTSGMCWWTLLLRLLRRWRSGSRDQKQQRQQQQWHLQHQCALTTATAGSPSP